MSSPENKLIVSVYDRTGEWPLPYKRAGYPVLHWDGSIEGCVLEHFDRLCNRIREALEAGCTMHGVMLAPPCTHLAGSGARWWKAKDATPPEEGDVWNIIDYAKALVWIGLHLIDLFPPQWWVLENPVGRLETLCPDLKPHRRMAFDPCDYGDPYTKRTILWGQFNTTLPKQPTLFVIPDYIHNMPPSPDRAAKRSVTPRGFAQAFFQANP